MIGVSEKIGQNIHNIRKSMKISQKDLSKKLQISTKQLQKYENAENNISVSMLYTIAEALNVDILLLILDFKQNDINLSNIEMNFFNTFHGIKNIEIKKKIINLVECMKSNQDLSNY